MTSLDNPVETSPTSTSRSQGSRDLPAPARRDSGRVRRGALRAAGIIGTLALWHLYALGPGEAASMPTPWEVAERIGELAQTSDYWSAIGSTLVLAACGLLTSIAVGVPLGLLNGLSPKITRSTQFIVDFFRTVPPIALVPLLLLVWGGTTTMALILITFGAMWPLLIQSTYAMGQVSPQLKQVAQAFHLTRRDQLRSIYLPSVLPFLMTGFRIAATLSLLLAIVAGFFGGVAGIGADLHHSLELSDPPTMFVYAVTAACLGVLLNGALSLLQNKVLWWHASVRGDNR